MSQNKTVKQFKFEQLDHLRKVNDWIIYLKQNPQQFHAVIQKIENMVNDTRVEIMKLNEPVKSNKGFFRRLWESTVFPDMIAAKRLKKQQARELKKKKEVIRAKAQEAALLSMEPELAEHYKKQELDKLTGKSGKDKLQKLADAFSGNGGSSSQDRQNKFASMLGGGMNNFQQGNNNVSNQAPQQEFNTDPNKILGSNYRPVRKQAPKKQVPQKTPEELMREKFGF